MRARAWKKRYGTPLSAVAVPRSIEEDRMFEQALSEFDTFSDGKVWVKVRMSRSAAHPRPRRAGTPVHPIARIMTTRAPGCAGCWHRCVWRPHSVGVPASPDLCSSLYEDTGRVQEAISAFGGARRAYGVSCRGSEVHSRRIQTLVCTRPQEDIRNIEAGRVPLPLYGSTRSESEGGASGRDAVSWEKRGSATLLGIRMCLILTDQRLRASRAPSATC